MDNNYEKMRAATQQNREDKARRSVRYERESADRLARSMERHFRTTFIGALSHFEETFGHLWGGRAPLKDLTESQLKARRAWEFARSNVLDNGNGQLRAALAELAEYSVEWNRHTITDKD